MFTEVVEKEKLSRPSRVFQERKSSITVLDITDTMTFSKGKGMITDTMNVVLGKSSDMPESSFATQGWSGAGTNR